MFSFYNTVHRLPVREALDGIHFLCGGEMEVRREERKEAVRREERKEAVRREERKEEMKAENRSGK